MPIKGARAAVMRMQDQESSSSSSEFSSTTLTTRRIRTPAHVSEAEHDRSSPSLISSHRDSMLCMSALIQHDKSTSPCLLKNNCKSNRSRTGSSDDDDDTASTASASDSSFSLMSGTGCNNVSFCEPLVTEVHYRPKTSRQDKSTLFYTDHEYREFRREYSLYGKYGRDGVVVSFTDNVVTAVHTYPKPKQPSDLYYSESDLKRFLNEFVESLTAASSRSC